MFSLFTRLKRQVIESLLSVSKNTNNLWNVVCVDKGRNLCNTFPLIVPCCIACQKSNCFEFIFKGNVYHQMSDCIKSRIMFYLWSHWSKLKLLKIFPKPKIGNNFAISNFWRQPHQTSIPWPKLHWLTHTSITNPSPFIKR